MRGARNSDPEKSRRGLKEETIASEGVLNSHLLETGVEMVLAGPEDREPRLGQGGHFGGGVPLEQRHGCRNASVMVGDDATEGWGP